MFLLTTNGEKDNGCIVNTVAQVASDPTRLAISVQKHTLTGETVASTGELNLSVLTEDVPFDLIRRFVGESGFRGQIDIDIFDIDGTYYISEVNPRFGGGYPHAYECGVNHMKLIANNLEGVANAVSIGDYEEGLVMMKYNEIRMTKV